VSDGPLFVTDDEIARRLRAIAGEVRTLASRRRAVELAGELEQLARILEPAERPEEGAQSRAIGRRAVP
jgi:hypothetical protein